MGPPPPVHTPNAPSPLSQNLDEFVAFARERQRFNTTIFSLIDKYMADETKSHAYFRPPNHENLETNV